MIQAHYIYCILYCYHICATSDHQALEPALELIYLSGSCKALRCGFADSRIYMLSEAVG